MIIELLYFDGCPSWQGALKNLKTALAIEGIDSEIQLVKVNSDEQAALLKFLGSPSLRVDGVDWWPEERSRYNLSCRVYKTPLGMSGEPSVEMLCEKLRTSNQINSI